MISFFFVSTNVLRIRETVLVCERVKPFLLCAVMPCCEHTTYNINKTKIIQQWKMNL